MSVQNNSKNEKSIGNHDNNSVNKDVNIENNSKNLIINDSLIKDENDIIEENNMNDRNNQSKIIEKNGG